MKPVSSLVLAVAASIFVPVGLSAQAWVGPDLEAPYFETEIGSFAMRWSQSFVVPYWASTHVGTTFWWSGTFIDPMDHFWIAYVSRDPEFDVNGPVINSEPAGWLGLGGLGAVTPGETIYLWLAGNNGLGEEEPEGMPYIRITEADTYDAGTLEAFYEPQVGDLHFRALFTVPEPSVLLLLMGGLAGVAIAARRRLWS